MDGLMRTAESVHNTSVSRLPVRVLLLDGRLGRSSIGSHYENGDLRSLQDPSRALPHQTGVVRTHPIPQASSGGTFRFVQEQEDQIGCDSVAMRSISPIIMPIFRPGDWDNDRYAVHVNGGSRLWKDRLPAGLRDRLQRRAPRPATTIPRP